MIGKSVGNRIQVRRRTPCWPSQRTRVGIGAPMTQPSAARVFYVPVSGAGTR